MKRLIVIIVMLITSVAVAQEDHSVLITPHTRLEVQRVQQPQPQPQPQPVQPQVIYVQPQTAIPQVAAPRDRWSEYMRMRMWFNMNYQQRGILFPRYVRRSPADTMQRYIYYQMLMNR